MEKVTINCFNCIFCNGASSSNNGVVCKLNNSDTYTLDICYLFIHIADAIPLLLKSKGIIINE